MNYTKIVRLNTLPFAENVRVYSTDRLVVTAMAGPMDLLTPVMRVQQSEGAVGLTSAVDSWSFGQGNYLVISHIQPAMWPPKRSEPMLAIAEVVGAVALENPGLLGETVFEGVVVVNHQVIHQPNGPVRLATPTQLNPEAFSATLRRALDDVGRLGLEDRERFRLASRWYVRGLEALNPVDKFLHWYIALEVYPAMGGDVVKSIQNLLHEKVYPGVDKGKLKERLQLGTICNLRGDIVHKGLAIVDLPSSPRFDQAMQRLEALVPVCIRLLTGLPPGTDLDRWVLDGEQG